MKNNMQTITYTIIIVERQKIFSFTYAGSRTKTTEKTFKEFTEQLANEPDKKPALADTLRMSLHTDLPS